jgi:hypothetical protein
VPGALDNITGERSLIQWLASMGTRGSDSVELQALAQQDHWHASRSHPVQLVLLDPLHRQHSFIVLAACLPGCNGHVGHDRVQRMAEPGPIEQALEASWRFAMRTDQDPYHLLQAIAEPLRERLRRGLRCRGHFGLRNRYRRFGHRVFSL